MLFSPTFFFFCRSQSTVQILSFRVHSRTFQCLSLPSCKTSITNTLQFHIEVRFYSSPQVLCAHHEDPVPGAEALQHDGVSRDPHHGEHGAGEEAEAGVEVVVGEGGAGQGRGAHHHHRQEEGATAADPVAL